MTHSSTNTSITLDTINLHEALAAFSALDHLWGIVPTSAAADVTDAWNLLTRAAHAQGLRTLRKLLSRPAAALRELVGTDGALAKVTDTDARATIHTHRNILTAVAIASAASISAEIEPVLADCRIALHARTNADNRPLATDEIILLRTYTALLATRTAGQCKRSAGTLALTQNGLLISETGKVSASDFLDIDDDGRPSAVLAPGDRNADPRFVELDRFTRNVLRGLITPNAPGPLLYRARVNARSTRESMKVVDMAAISASGIINRTLIDTGLKHADVQPSSLRRWRIAETWHNEGDKRAKELAGTSAATTLRLAGVRIREATTATRATPEDRMPF